MSGFNDLFSGNIGGLLEGLPVVGSLAKLAQGQSLGIGDLIGGATALAGPLGALGDAGAVAGDLPGFGGGLSAIQGIASPDLAGFGGGFDALTGGSFGGLGSSLGLTSSVADLPGFGGGFNALTGGGLGDLTTGIAGQLGLSATPGLGELSPDIAAFGGLNPSQASLDTFGPGTNTLGLQPSSADIVNAGTIGQLGEQPLSGLNSTLSRLGLGTSQPQSGFRLTDSPTSNLLSAIPPADEGASPGTEGVLGDIAKFVKNNKTLLNLGLTGSSLLGQALTGGIPIPAALRTGVQQAANQTGAAANIALQQGQALAPSLSTGQLPPGAEQLVQNQLKDEQTAIRSKFAQLGLSGSTAEQQDLSQAEARAQALRFTLAQQATQIGLAALVDSGQLTQKEANDLLQIANAKIASDNELSNALGNVASSFSFGAGQAAGSKILQ